MVVIQAMRPITPDAIDQKAILKWFILLSLRSPAANAIPVGSEITHDSYWLFSKAFLMTARDF